MLRDIFTNKWILGGIGLLLIIAAACYIWYQHDLKAYKEQAAETAQLARQWETNQKPSGQAATQKRSDPPVQSDTQSEDNTQVAQYNGKIIYPGDIVDGRIFLGTEKPSAELLSQLRSQDEIISPYGFGPYPELPQGFGPITWPRKDALSELMIRVRIKLLKQGVLVEGMAEGDDGFVYPIIKGVRYVRWGETSDGRQYLRETIGHPDDSEYIKTVADAKFATWESVTPADFQGIQIIPMEEGGIDPYTFLNLQR